VIPQTSKPPHTAHPPSERHPATKPPAHKPPAKPPAHKPAGKPPGHGPVTVHAPDHTPAPVHRNPHPAPAPIATTADADQAHNQHIFVYEGERLGGSVLAILAACCAGWGENSFHTYGCNGDSGCGCSQGCCGAWQIDCSKQADHAYTDVTYWTDRAYQQGFYGGFGGIISIAHNHPDYSPGYIANMCQGAYSNLAQGGAYYDRYLDLARQTYNTYKGKGAPPATGGYTPSSHPTPVQQYNPTAAASFYHWPGNYANAITHIDDGAIRGADRANEAWAYVKNKRYIPAPRKG
jgi:hypothetical protein